MKAKPAMKLMDARARHTRQKKGLARWVRPMQRRSASPPNPQANTIDVTDDVAISGQGTLKSYVCCFHSMLLLSPKNRTPVEVLRKSDVCPMKLQSSPLFEPSKARMISAAKEVLSANPSDSTRFMGIADI